MRSAIVLLMLSAAAGTLAAQSAPVMALGHRVWVETLTASGSLDRELKGFVERASGDTLLIRPDGGGPLVPLLPTERTQFHVFEGRRPSAGRGAVTGFFVGAAAGAIIGAVTYRDCPPHGWCFVNFGQGTSVVLGGIAVGLGGLLAGGIVGSFINHDVWSDPMGFAVARPLITATSRGVGIGLSIRLK